jgi:hypothetical protein
VAQYEFSRLQPDGRLGITAHVAREIQAALPGIGFKVRCDGPQCLVITDTTLSDEDRITLEGVIEMHRDQRNEVSEVSTNATDPKVLISVTVARNGSHLVTAAAHGESESKSALVTVTVNDNPVSSQAISPEEAGISWSGVLDLVSGDVIAIQAQAGDGRTITMRDLQVSIVPA